MAGIVSYGAYIPIYRLSRDEIARAWGGGGRGGEKAVANWDEDSLTMGVEAVIDCLNNMNRELVDGLYFASTTPPYREKQSASIMAAAADLRRELVTADFTDSATRSRGNRLSRPERNLKALLMEDTVNDSI